MATIETSTLVGLLRARAAEQPGRPVYTFLDDGEGQQSQLTHAQLDRRARAVGAALQERAATKRTTAERALLLYPPGLEYIVGFFGCMYGGAIAVPAYPPEPTALDRTLPRLQAIVADAEASIILTTSELRALARPLVERLPGLADLRWVTTDELPDAGADAGADPGAPAWSEPAADGHDVAFLQYTSGSTDAPRGVVLTHQNLLHNSACIESCFGHGPHSQGVIWLPPYHDMGLIGGIIQPLFAGFPVTLMSPLHFLQRPLRWLRAVSRFGATTSGGPNFAYDLCVRKSTVAERRALDLSRWDLAFNGAEPVRADTLERFADAFAVAGFRRTAFYPCYGLAEATLIVAGGDKPAAPVVRRIEAGALASDRVVAAPAESLSPSPGRVARVVSCGVSLPEQDIVIVEPESRRRAEPGEVGEIWVRGPSVARGYWGRPEASARVFGAHIEGAGGGPYLRTGDLGFLDEGQLFVTGRLKDLIVVRGRNYYPQDVERTVERSHPALRPGCVAVFTVHSGGDRGGDRAGQGHREGGDDGDEPQLVVVSELEGRRAPDLPTVLAQVRRAVQAAHELPLRAIVLVEPRTIAKTSSGKIQRFACRDGFIAGQLHEVARWERAHRGPASVAVVSAGSSPSAEPEPSEPSEGIQPAEREAAGSDRVAAGDGGVLDSPRSVLTVRAWLRARVAEVLGIPADALDERAPLADLGLSSAQAVSLTGELEIWLGRRLAPTLVYQHPTLEALARALVEGAPTTSDEAVREQRASEPLAIVGIGCRFPGAAGPDELWTLLVEGRDAITEVDPARERRVGPLGGGGVPRWGGFLADDQIARFDPERFGVSPREAAAMDPQHRLLLETSWEALEDAGLAPPALAGRRVGVFVGICTDDYSRLPGADADVYAGTGNASSIAANRISYWLDVRGPSLAVDTACSSSLVAVHLACRSLWSGESSLALVGGVNLILAPSLTASLARAGFLAADGRCKAFDARADGYGRGEGVGVVVLKPLSRARTDGDRIHAVIRGSAIGSDGGSNGLTAPRGEAQQQVLQAAYDHADVSPDRVGYVEAHGTGTELGDPIEVEALAAVLGPGRSSDSPCRIGSIKSNIGHLEGAAGIAGLIKTALALSHRIVPPSIHFETPNPHIPFDTLPVRVQTRAEPWPAPEGRGDDGEALAGVSSFGFGGTNAHVVLGAAPRRAPIVVGTARAVEASAGGEPVLLPISGPDARARRALAQSYQVQLQPPGVSLPAVAAAAGLRRGHLSHRLGVVAADPQQAVRALGRFIDGQVDPAVVVGEVDRGGPGPLALVFSGQGSQWCGMGRELLERWPVFGATIEQIDRSFAAHATAPHAAWSILDELWAPPSDSWLVQTDRVQPVLFAVQVALAHVLRQWGVHAEAAVGHSVGEIAAAHIAGALPLDDAVALVAHRGRVMHAAAGQGRMALVGLSPEAIREALAPWSTAVEIAAINGPDEVVVSGDASAIESLSASLVERDVFFRVLDHAYPFHSAHMQPYQAPLAEALAGIRPRAGSMVLVSAMTGHARDGDRFDARYWVEQIRAPVRFAAAVDHLMDRGFRRFVEIGPHPTLVRSIRRGLADRGIEGLVLGSLRRDEDGRVALLRTLGSLYAHGHDVDWSGPWPQGVRHVELPATPWSRRECWIEPPRSVESPSPGLGHPLLGRRLELAHRPDERIWRTVLRGSAPAYLAAHRFGGTPVLPASAYFEIALAAVAQLRGPGSHHFSDVEIVAPMVLLGDDARQVQTVLGEDADGSDGRLRFRIFSRPNAGQGEGAWVLHATGIVVARDDAEADVPSLDPEAMKARFDRSQTGDEFYRSLARRQLDYGPEFRGITEVWRGVDQALAQVQPASASVRDDRSHRIHPALLDAAAQVVGALGHDPARPFLPVGAAAVRFFGPATLPLWSHARRVSAKDELGHAHERVVDLSVHDASGACVVQVEGLRLRELDADAVRSGPRLDDALYRVTWPKAAGRVRLPRARPPASWVVFMDAAGVGRALVERLEARGDRCLRVRAGAGLVVHTEDSLTIDPARAEDMHAVFEALRRPDWPPPRGVIHLWSLDAVRPDRSAASLADEVAMLGADQARGPTTVLHALRELAGQRWREPPCLWLVTRGSRRLPDDSDDFHATASPTPAMLWGLGRTIAQEHPDLFGALVDLDAGQSPSQGALDLLGVLDGADDEPQIAIRAGVRHVARLLRASELGRPPRPLRCRPDASYLVTGGLGGLGLRVARALVEWGARRLVLMGRTALPPRRQWATLGPESRAATQVAAIRELEASGVSVHLAAVDVGDPARLAEFIEGFRAEGWPPIRGVIHLAGVLHDRILMRLDASMLAAVNHAKVGGAWLLHRLLADPPLDFFAMFSSIAAVLGSAGQGNYAAANAFLDALAHHRRARGQSGHAIDWGPWAEVGVATPERRGHRLASRGIEGIEPEQGTALLARILAHDVTPVTAARVDWTQLARAYPTLAASPLVAELVAAQSPSAPGDRVASAEIRAAILAASPTERRGTLVDLLVTHVARAVGRIPEEIETDRPLTALGLDSLMGLELKNQLEARSGVSVPMGTLLAGPTIAELADELLGRMGAGASTAQPSDTRVITLRSGGTRPRVWCIHPGALDVGCYDALVQALGPDQPFDVIRVAELEAQYSADDPQGGADTPLPVLARRVVEILRAAQPEDPYVVCGWSIGGALAFEVARVLHEQGQRLALVALLDAPTPEISASAAGYDQPVLVGAFASYLQARAGRFVEPPELDPSVSADARLSALLCWASDARLLPAELDVERLRLLFEIWRRGLQRSVRRLAALEAVPCAVPLAYFRAGRVLDAFADVFPRSAEAWSARTTAVARIYDVPGDHYSMFHQPHVQSLARELRRALATALDRHDERGSHVR